MATYAGVDDELKALQAPGIRFPKKQKHPKATLAELLTLAIFHGVFSLREKQSAPGPGPRQWTGIARSLAKPHPRPGHAGTQVRLLQSLPGCNVYAQSLLSLPPPPQDVPLRGSSSRFYRVLQKAQGLLAHFAVRVFWGKGLRKLRVSAVTQVVDLKPLLLAYGQRVHGLHLPDAAVGMGYVLLPVMNERGLERTFSWLTGFRRLTRDFVRFARTIEASI